MDSSEGPSPGDGTKFESKERNQAKGPRVVRVRSNKVVMINDPGAYHRPKLLCSEYPKRLKA